MSNLEALDEVRSRIRPRGSRQAGNLRPARPERSRVARPAKGTPTDRLDAGTSQAELHAAQTALANASRIATLAEMSASVAHEVNQPLAAIVMGAEAGLRWLARDDMDIAKVGQILRNIVSNARRASDIVRRIRDVAMKNEPELVAVDLNAVVEDSLPLVRHELEAQSVSLSATLGAGLPAVRGDRIQLQQVLVNLLVNSVQAISQAGRPTRRIHLETGVDANGAVCLSVRDSGPGIPAENLDRVFQSFFTTKKGGMGIGLAICHSIITAHGGRMVASNHPEGGAEFRFAIPPLPASVQPNRRLRSQGL